MPAEEEQARVTVEADIFSGRPNPSWTLKDDEGGEFRRRLAALEPASGSFDGGPEGLGYRGLIIRIAGDVTETVRVRQGSVDYKAATWADTDRSLERWAVSTAEGKIDSALVDLLRREAAK